MTTLLEAATRNDASHEIANRNGTAKKLVAGTGGSVVVDRCQVCDSPISNRSCSWLSPAGEHDAGRRLQAERTAGVSGTGAALQAMHARSTWLDRRSGDPVSSELSVHQRHDEDPARKLRRIAPARSRRSTRWARTTL